MKMKIRNTLITVIVGIILFSCLTVNKEVTYLRPAELTISSEIKNVAILSSGYSYRQQIYDILFNVFGREEVRKRFELIDRENLNVIMREQNLFNQDDFSDSEAVELGELAGANAIILGSFKNVREDMANGNVVINRKYEKGRRVNQYGIEVIEYRYQDESVPSIIKTYYFTVDIRMLDIKRGTLIHNEQKTYKIQYENYIDNKPDNFNYVKKKNAQYVQTFPSMLELLESSGKSFSKFFAKKVAPFYQTDMMSFERIGNDAINNQFIKFIKSDLYDEALEIMTDSLDAIGSIDKERFRARHYYNLGAVYEMKGELQLSLEYYNKAVKEDATKLHLAALREIKKRIAELEKLKTQIENGKKDEPEEEEW